MLWLSRITRILQVLARVGMLKSGGETTKTNSAILLETTSFKAVLNQVNTCLTRTTTLCCQRTRVPTGPYTLRSGATPIVDLRVRANVCSRRNLFCARCRRMHELGEGLAVIKLTHARLLRSLEPLRARCRRTRELGGGLAVIKLTHTRLLI